MEDLPYHSPNRTFITDKGKDKILRSQEDRVFNAFLVSPKTMLMVSQETGIYRANICRYVSDWEDSGFIALVREGLCPISKHRAGFYTTNPELFPNPNQEEI